MQYSTYIAFHKHKKQTYNFDKTKKLCFPKTYPLKGIKCKYIFIINFVVGNADLVVYGKNLVIHFSTLSPHISATSINAFSVIGILWSIKSHYAPLTRHILGCKIISCLYNFMPGKADSLTSGFMSIAFLSTYF